MMLQLTALKPGVEIHEGARANSEQLGAPLALDPLKAPSLNVHAGYQRKGFLNKAWPHGYKPGVISSSCHGSSHICAGFYSHDPPRQGVLEAIGTRATSGARNNVNLDDTMGEHFMGDGFPLANAEPLEVKLTARAISPTWTSSKDRKVLYTTTFNQPAVEFDYTDESGVTGIAIMSGCSSNISCWPGPARCSSFKIRSYL